MEDWQFELEFLTYDAYEEAIKKASGITESVEEFETDPEEMKQYAQELMGQDFDPAQWEEL